MALVDLIGAKLEALETCIEDKLHALFAEFILGRSPSPTRSQQSEIPNHKEKPLEKEECKIDLAPTRMRVDFPQWEDGDPTRWLSHVERYFLYHRTPEISMMDITAIYLEEMLYNGIIILSTPIESQHGGNSRAGSKAARRRGGQPRPAPMQSRPPMARP
ncbi:hypothetical protein B296_00043857 [Ensete ventricosum]|uniref:Uncharacterized protein n=1 Tax=Ensete ventricosum TaxID=4639 RepID=A0A426YTS1_ENSVE|nr:hypothetical protein B296_00043857 [Ensete ventricosum]